MGNIIIDVDITQCVSVPSIALLIVSAVDDGQIVIPAVSLELFPNLICLIFGSGLIEERNIVLKSSICSPETRARTQMMENRAQPQAPTEGNTPRQMGV